jgi:hypothetical protein
MNYEIKQKLLLLENRDNIHIWFKQIHKKDLNLIRTKQINSAAKQSSEFFKNSSKADLTVRPLLTFYGIASLSRALILLLKGDGGEESLTPGHGLRTLNWQKTLSGELQKGLISIKNLEIETCSGLFSSLVKETNNRTSIHVNSSGVDWHLNYEVLESQQKMTLVELISRIPDLEFDLRNIDETPKYASISQMTFTAEKGFEANVHSNNFENIKETFINIGFKVEQKSNIFNVSCTGDFFEQNVPLFLHKYIHKTFGSIPELFIIEPFQNKQTYSEISLSYILSYYLGMLVRYFPTHWNSLVQGEKGDLLWPILNRAQNYVESVFPELVIELILDVLKEKK